jgi:hypothetical protein
MSRDELVYAFFERRISRRIFIAGMVAAGVSTLTALSYANALDRLARDRGYVPQGLGRPGYDLYGDYGDYGNYGGDTDYGDYGDYGDDTGGGDYGDYGDDTGHGRPPDVPRGKGPPPGRPPHGGHPPGDPPSGTPPGSNPPGGGRGRP